MKKWTFPAGERGVLLDAVNIDRSIYTVQCNFRNSDSIIDLLLETDAARRTYPNAKIDLLIPYFPYARQDRVMQLGESHSLKVIANLINSLNFNNVVVVDPHSDVVEALVDRLTIVTQTEAIERTIGKNKLLEYNYFIAPDAGALKKVYKTSTKHNIPVICAQKTRDVTSGAITGIKVNSEDYANAMFKRALIIDDICDGGRTFIELRKELPHTTTVDLFVTHGIFSAGLDKLTPLFNEIYCYNNFANTTV